MTSYNVIVYIVVVGFALSLFANAWFWSRIKEQERNAFEMSERIFTLEDQVRLSHLREARLRERNADLSALMQRYDTAYASLASSREREQRLE